MGFGCLVVNGCGSDFSPDYEIPSPSGSYVALLGSRTRFLKQNHHLRILREGQIVLDAEIWFDRIESGIADARWSSDGSEFAVKVCGDGVKFVTIFDVSTGRTETLQGAELSRVPAWTGFDDSCIFGYRLDAYRVSAKSS